MIEKIFINLLWINALFLVLIMPGYADNGFDPNASLGELISELASEVSTELDAEIHNKEKFIKEFEEYEEKTGVELKSLLDDFTNIIKGYADTEGIEESSTMLFEEFAQLSEQLNGIILRYPGFDEVEKIITPLTEGFEKTLIRQFPKLKKFPPKAGPLADIFDFYIETERRDPFNTGSFFRSESLKKETKSKMLKEIKNEVTKAGIKMDKIIFREINEFKNERLVFHQKVINDQIVEEFEVLEDLTVFHGLPEQMRREGVEEKYVLFVEEYLKLINYHLINAHNELGLIVDINHPQLYVSGGYTPEEFVENFIMILLPLSS